MCNIYIYAYCVQIRVCVEANQCYSYVNSYCTTCGRKVLKITRHMLGDLVRSAAPEHAENLFKDKDQRFARCVDFLADDAGNRNALEQKIYN